ncbi:DUF1992 domain-containing protein [Arsenicicoccus dermatophilus]|uniref:DnaJ family domain-containing protein n=1 Tax=Arsenicicoccus dermatophilus TaxID=1076331 RepID=UPI001F4D2E6F|nr:DUF1992 domain-containing protein [Arsenicicoccus dermatophilus]MCH8612959.1 DUF1992 domain-containing protein [Arsenicicoccus dermatophilus]
MADEQTAGDQGSRRGWRPPPTYVESIAEKRIREAQERGEFDNLKGAGKPLPSLDRPYREDWWINGLVEREQLDLTGAMNPTMALRREAHDIHDTVRDVTREEAVREIAEDLNHRVRQDRLRPASGPQMPPVAPTVDVDEVLAVWREHRRLAVRAAEESAERERARSARLAQERRENVWWRRLGRRRS